MTAKQPAVKKYVAKLSAEERDGLTALIQKGKAPARRVLKARLAPTAAERALVDLKLGGFCRPGMIPVQTLSRHHP